MRVSCIKMQLLNQGISQITLFSVYTCYHLIVSSAAKLTLLTSITIEVGEMIDLSPGLGLYFKRHNLFLQETCVSVFTLKSFVLACFGFCTLDWNLILKLV